jgi:hypothetical protein
LPKHPDDRRDYQPNQTHKKKLAYSSQASFRHRAEERHRAKHTGGDDEG